jgi:hypothetical protein
MRIPAKLTLVLALALTGACGPTRAQIRPTSPFTPQLARLFDDSVDFVTDVEGLGGRVAADWQAQIDGLSRSSDLISEARIETVVLGTDVDGTRNYRLTAALSNVITGQAPEDNHVSLRVSEGQGGFNTVAGKEARLQSGRYILFVKWYTDGAGEVRAHWHLSPYTEALLARVRRASGVEERTLGTERVVRTEGGGAR